MKGLFSLNPLSFYLSLSLSFLAIMRMCEFVFVGVEGTTISLGHTHCLGIRHDHSCLQAALLLGVGAVEGGWVHSSTLGSGDTGLSSLSSAKV